ncbi:hypothetical protein AtubIFM56815_007665 [Aspergillus tubingensis]|uniref:Uncharacterized protein n=2 Tax=Aspergillus subgen. Circumdati TaxID=2720871 RepID=A0A124BWG7_ASPNG|nr:hypothetical protein ANI_1_1914064 [Aspergillus niger]GLA64847.1 hypothetical protein AtubIFM54640_006580 [Aspergillus tubingensis]GLA83469.1 hypothetical protein AtubIFM56815_007665 [Aspergillus tubingensis]GLA90967.1 hypothetical protein AtubIFM57143_000583 [Aspergillus tubingensis]
MPIPGGINASATAAATSIDIDEDTVQAKIQYLVKDEQHQHVKPYYLHFQYDSDIAPTNTAADDRIVPIHNARNLDIPSKEMFSEYGFTQLHLDCPLAPEEYYYDKRVEEVLYPQYKSLARELFPEAERVEVLEHATRKRHPLWLSEGIERHELDTNQPSDYVHIDMTASSAAKCSIKQFNIHPKTYSRFIVVNLWKPIRGPVYDFPITVCDRRTVDYASQTTAMDIVARDYVNENTRIYYDEKHKWYYWHGLQANEVIAFVQADSRAENSAGVPHTAFKDPRNSDSTQLRESIEARVFVYFD